MTDEKEPTEPQQKSDGSRTRARDRFIEKLAETSNVTAACEAAGWSRDTAYRRKASSPAFARLWDEALAIAKDGVYAEARRRAIEGVEEPVYQGGKQVGTIRKYSDRMLEILLKGHHPEFRENTQIAVVATSGAELRDAATEIGRLRRISYALAMGAMAKARQRPALPAPTPDESYREQPVSEAVRQSHPGATPEEPRVEHEINPRAERDSSGHGDGKPRYWNPNASAHEMGREDE